MRLLFFAVTTLMMFSGCVVFVPLIADDPFKTESDEVIVIVPPFPPAASTTESVRRTVRATKLDRLIRSLERGDPATRTNAATSLGYLKPVTPRAVDALIKALSDNSKNVRRASVKSLARMKAREAVPYLARALHDRDKYVAHSAARALRQIGTRDALNALEKANG